MAAEDKQNESDSVRRIDIEQKVRSAYLDYAMSVITARALPDVRDGLKPVQRRILYAMGDMNLTHDQPTKKSARIVGEVLGKYHPHSDTAVYDSMVRMAQDFSMRYVLVDGQGNFGSVDGDGAAAIRYTEARLAKLGEEMLADLEMNTVDFIANYDGSAKEPTVLPAKLPNLLVNGTNGIAVGMATNIPPHNLGEVADAVVYLIDHLKQIDDVTVDDLLRFIPGPDFPTGGAILGNEGIRSAYASGKGAITVRARAHVEEMKGGHSAIIVTELPYQVNKASLVERIAELVRDGRIEGIGDLRDESDRTGMRIVIELKRGQDAEPVLAALLKLTQMQGAFGINMLALVDGEPRVLSLKRILLCHIEHRQQVITRRSQFELEKALARAHILEGLLKALDQLDEVIQTIRRSRTAETALTNLMEKFDFSELQARAILDMQLRRLAALERQKIQDEYREVKERIAYLQALLKSKDKILDLVKADMLALKTAYGDARRTRITLSGGEGTLFENMVPDEESLVLITTGGQAKRLPAEGARMEEGQLVPGISLQEGDTPRWLLAAHSKDTLYFIDTLGHAQVLAAHQVPDIAQQEHGLPLKNLLHLPNGEQIAAVLAVNELSEDRYMTFFTRQGKVKRVVLSELSSLGAGGVVIGIAEGDALLRALITDGQQELLVVSANGRALRFKEDEVRPQGRAGGGMRAIALAEGDEVVGADAALPDGELVVVSQQAYAKRCPLSEFNTQGRGGQGVYAVDASKQKDAGPLAFALAALPQDDIVFVTEEKRMVRRALHDLPELPRASWGRIVSPSRKGAVLILGDDKLSGILALAAGMPKATGAPPAPEPKAKAASSRETITETSLLATKDDKKQATPKAHAQVMKTAVVKPDAKSSKAQVAPSRPAAKPATKSVKRGAAVKAAMEPPEKTARSQPARSADTTPKAAVNTKGANAPVKEPAKPKAAQTGAVGSAAKVAASRTDAADESARTKSSAAKSAKSAPSQAVAGTTVGKPASAGAANKSAAKSASASVPTEPKPSLRKSKTDKAMPALTQQEPAAKTAHKPAAAPTTAAKSAQETVQPAPTQAELSIPGAPAARGRRVVSKKPQRALVPHATKEKE